MDDLLLAWKNLWRNKRRTLITLAAIGLSITLMQAAHNLAVGVYARMIDSGVRAGSGHLALYRDDFARSRDQKLSYEPGALVAQLRALDGVEAALPRVYLAGLAQSSRESRGVLLTGVDPAPEYRVNPFLRRLPQAEMIDSLSGRQAVVGKKLLEELKIKPGGKFVVTVQHRDGELASELLRVHGVIETGIKEIDRSLVMVGLQRAARMAGTPGEIHELALILNSAADERALVGQIRELLQGHPQVRLLDWQQAMPNLADAIRLDYTSQKFIFLIITIIVTIGVVNTLLMSVMERIPEFGVILALGASPGRLRRMLLCESALLGLLGMLVGSLLGCLATWYLVDTGIDLRRFVSGSLEFGGVVFDPVMRATWDIGWMLRMALYVFGLSVLAALYPAGKAARISPARAMRYH